MILSLIGAMARNRVVGVDNRLPWRLPEDLKRFKALTSGHPVIMGRKTYESIGRLLPERLNIILTRQKNYNIEGASVVSSLDEALALAKKSPGAEEVYVIGGAEIWQIALPLAQRIDLTLIDRHVEGDAYFPKFSESEFDLVLKEERSEPERFWFMRYERKHASRA